MPDQLFVPKNDGKGEKDKDKKDGDKNGGKDEDSCELICTFDNYGTMMCFCVYG